ncbi:hypothetical protein Vadar_003558 [Vaccinium darrowii]|uniref:Uncharacterized protein n=1 Tax=Vaccinium darrowii TaxID=229202 RepID=A0ACB7XPC6_9ERIC|nr:hypothetical protein Vadar_003558 [Vaccinium darrowii]
MKQSKRTKEEEKKLSIVDLPNHITTEILEQLRVVHGPPEFDIHKKKFWNLFCTDVTHDYGIKESWTKEFVIENGICSRGDGLLYMVEPIMILASGEILMLVNRRSLVQYNPKLGSLKNLNIYGFKSVFYAAGYIPSFVSLRDAAKGERLTLLRTKKFSFGCESSEAEAKIYTLGEGPWRNLGRVPFVLDNHSFYASLNGAFHWLTFDPRSPDFIRCFDFDNEQLRVVDGPPEFGIQKKKCLNHYCTDVSLGVLRGSLSICDISSQSCVDIWMMKDYGITESWTKEFVIENGFCRGGRLDILEPTVILDSGEILMLVNRKSLVQYNPKLGSFKNLNVYGFESEFTAVGHIPSFVSLPDAANEERLTLLRFEQLLWFPVGFSSK